MKRCAIGMSLVDRLDFHSIPVTESGCSVWLGASTANGYGQITVGGKRELAHRMSWVATNGPISAGLCVLHRCDVRCCINADHLFLGTEADNSEDMRQKRRSLDGTKNNRAKLTPVDVATIRTSQETSSQIAKIYGINPRHARAIRAGKYWLDLAEAA